MNPEIEVLELLRATCASLRVGRKRSDLWEAAARQEKKLMAEIEELKRKDAPLLAGVAGHA